MVRNRQVNRKYPSPRVDVAQFPLHTRLPGGVTGNTAVFGTAFPGSTPGRVAEMTGMSNMIDEMTISANPGMEGVEGPGSENDR